MSIVVVSVHDEKYEPLAEWTLHKNKKPYCEKHGYILHYASDGGASVAGKPMMAKPQPPIPDTHIPMGWGKVFVIKEAMEKVKDGTITDYKFNPETAALERRAPIGR